MRRRRGRAAKALTTTAIAALASLTALTLSACSVTVTPKAAAATVSPTTTTPAKPGTPTKAGTDAPPTTPTPAKPTGKDVDATACAGVKNAASDDLKKVAADAANQEKLAVDLKAVGTALRGEAPKTKNADLKSTIQKLAGYYTTMGNDVAALRTSALDADKKNIDTEGERLTALCPQEG